MYELLLLLIVAIAGYSAASAWFVLLGAAGLTAGSWAMKLKLLRQHPTVPFNSKMTTYFVTGVIAHLGLAWLAYTFGRLLAWWVR